MHARLTTLEAPPDRMDDATRFTQEQVLPQLQQLDGFKGFIVLSDRESGKVRGATTWRLPRLRLRMVPGKGAASGRPRLHPPLTHTCRENLP